MTNFHKVFDFHTAFDIITNTTLSEKTIKNFDISSLRIKLIDEEFNEYMYAPDLIEKLDAIGDLMYVVYGSCVSFGIDINTAFKNFCTPYAIAKSIDLNLLDNFVTNFDIIKRINLTYTDFDNFTSDFSNEIIKLSYHILKLSIDDIINSLCYMLFMLYNWCLHENIDADLLFNTIHISNMTKMCKSEKDAIKTIEWYNSNYIGRYKPIFKKSLNSNYYIVYDSITDKCLKSMYYSPPNIKSVLYFEK